MNHPAATFLVVSHWADGPGYREIDTILHDGEAAKAHKKMLLKEFCESAAVIGFLGGDHVQAAFDAEEMINDGKPFGRKALEKLKALHGCIEAVIH
jgi:hypothetical protein